MTEIRVIDSGACDRFFIHSVYEALAVVGEGNTLHLCYPESPYVSVGVHQVIDREIDTEYCEDMGIPFIRRDVGGGAVYLEPDQFFYHLVMRKEDTSGDIPAFYRRFLTPTVDVYQHYGLPAEYKPVNDVVIAGRKASGNAAKSVGDCILLVGNVIQAFDAKTAARLIRTSSEKYRDKIAATMEDYMTSLAKELGEAPSKEEIKEHYLRSYREMGFDLVEGTLSSEEKRIQKDIAEKLKSKEYLHAPRLRHPLLYKGVEASAAKIAGGIVVFEAAVKADKLVRVVLAAKDGVIDDISITGDFFVSPPSAVTDLEKELKGTGIEKESLTSTLTRFFATQDVNLAGFQIENLVAAILKAKKRSD